MFLNKWLLAILLTAVLTPVLASCGAATSDEATSANTAQQVDKNGSTESTTSGEITGVVLRKSEYLLNDGASQTCFSFLVRAKDGSLSIIAVDSLFTAASLTTVGDTVTFTQEKDSRVTTFSANLTDRK